jgi:hypothetical protein
VLALAGSTLPRHVLVKLRQVVASLVFLRVVAIYNYCLILGSYIAVVLALKVLLYLALLLVLLILEDLVLLD